MKHLTEKEQDILNISKLEERSLDDLCIIELLRTIDSLRTNLLSQVGVNKVLSDEVLIYMKERDLLLKECEELRRGINFDSGSTRMEYLDRADALQAKREKL